MRDYRYIDTYLDRLRGDIYPQPEDEGHKVLAANAIAWFKAHHSIGNEKSTILDVGCGTGFCRKFFDCDPYHWSGVTLGTEECIENIREKDFSFLGECSWDVIFARHVLEHSPLPLLTLMEWRRCGRMLWLVAPALEYWKAGGRNHYSVLNYEQLWALLRRSGWKITQRKILRTDDSLFLQSYRLEIEDPEERANLEHPGAPVPVEYWIMCIPGAEIIE